MKAKDELACLVKVPAHGSSAVRRQRTQYTWLLIQNGEWGLYSVLNSWTGDLSAYQRKTSFENSTN